MFNIKLKSDKKRIKNYDKVRKSVNDFCYRLQRIIEVFDPTSISK